MDVVKMLVGVILPYVALIVFVTGMIYRLYVWKKLPSPSMTLFPAPSGKGGNIANTLKELFFFKSLFAGDRVMWVLAWVFHAVLALIALGHLRVFFNVDAIMLATGLVTEEHIHAMSTYAGGAAGIVILVTIALIFARRLSLQRVREITGVSDMIALLLLAVIVISGDMMRFAPGQHIDLADTRAYFAALATFSNVMDMEILNNQMFLVHMCFALVLIMLIPFSKILHLGGFFFTHQLVRKQ
jgi:nitrate reductase gamma subunit